MEAVHLVGSHHVEHAHDLLLREEVAGHIDHETTVTEVRLVFNLHVGKGPSLALLQLLAINGGGEELLERLEAIEETRAVGRADLHAVFIDAQTVCFMSEIGIGLHRDVATGSCGVHGQADTQCALGLFSKFRGIAQGSVPRGHDTLKLGEAERTVTSGEAGGIRHQRKGLARLLEILDAHEGERLVYVGTVVPESEFLARAGTAPLVHVDPRVGLRRKHEVARVGRIGRGLPNEF